jgi:hypothetical protein
MLVPSPFAFFFEQSFGGVRVLPAVPFSVQRTPVMIWFAGNDSSARGLSAYCQFQNQYQ